jgi:riboflavin kinase / FMN adenylyltransferase
MKVLVGLKAPLNIRDAVVSLGVFDGVHLGHRRILSESVRKARSIGGKSVAVTFYPHPRGKKSIFSLEHRLRVIAETGIDLCLVLEFGKSLSQMSAQDFVRRILVSKIGARHVYVGKNFHFGRGASGDYRTLAAFGSSLGFSVKAFDVIKHRGIAVSSTHIRDLIMKGRLAQAAKLLSRPVSVFGTVIHGIKLGKSLGYPTANLDPHHEVLPPRGIYAVWVFLRGKKFPGLCYIGPKPAFAKSRQPKENIEVHILKFNKRIYGSNLEVQFIKKLREVKKFSTPQALSTGIKQDLIRAKAVFLHR